jgi:hypothetical protein
MDDYCHRVMVDREMPAMSSVALEVMGDYCHRVMVDQEMPAVSLVVQEVMDGCRQETDDRERQVALLADRVSMDDLPTEANRAVEPWDDWKCRELMAY